ncbi:MAG: hypothetical protein JNL21_25990 [Myxococcales bacterium]|nr:hypothetical protein [Myxococcales bacterium]
MEWDCTPHVRPVGEPNTIELRCGDTLLQVFVNGARVSSIVDADLGFGAFGWRAISLGAASRVLFQSIEVWSVGAAMRV